MISPVVQCLLPLLLVAGVVHPYYIEKQYKEPTYMEEVKYTDAPTYTKETEYTDAPTWNGKVKHTDAPEPIQEHAPAESTHGPVDVEHKTIEHKVIVDPIPEHAPAESTLGPIQDHAPAESTHGPVEVEKKPIDHKVIVDPVEVHINEPNDHVVMVEPNFNLGEHLSAYQMNEGLQLSQIGFFYALFGLFTREDGCQKECKTEEEEYTTKHTEEYIDETSYTEKTEAYTEKYTEETYTKKPDEYTQEASYSEKTEAYTQEASNTKKP